MFCFSYFNNLGLVAHPDNPSTQLVKRQVYIFLDSNEFEAILDYLKSCVIFIILVKDSQLLPCWLMNLVSFVF